MISALISKLHAGVCLPHRERDHLGSPPHRRRPLPHHRRGRARRLRRHPRRSLARRVRLAL